MHVQAGASCCLRRFAAVDNVYLIAAAWVGLALIASLVSIRLGVSVALVEIALGVVGGNFLGLGTTSWIDFLALVGSVLLTFLAGAEIDPGSLRRHIGPALAIGLASFTLPAAAAFLFAFSVAGWDLHAAEIAGIALSTTSVAVVYAVMIESGLAQQEIGKLILAACFVTDLGTVLALGILFADPGPGLLLFVAVTAAALIALPDRRRHLGRVQDERDLVPRRGAHGLHRRQAEIVRQNRGHQTLAGRIGLRG
jgi:Kef-type K+ transport system membrane component KefB